MKNIKLFENFGNLDDEEKTLEKIAKDELDIETLETRKKDILDFHDVSVWGVKKALELAFEAGKQSVKQKK